MRAEIMREMDNNAHSAFLLYYHLIMVTKYRRKVINDDISARGKEIFEYIAPNYGITLEEWNHDVMGVFSDGTKAEYPGYYRKAQEKLAREQRKLSHCL